MHYGNVAYDVHEAKLSFDHSLYIGAVPSVF